MGSSPHNERKSNNTERTPMQTANVSFNRERADPIKKSFSVEGNSKSIRP